MVLAFLHINYNSSNNHDASDAHTAFNHKVLTNSDTSRLRGSPQRPRRIQPSMLTWSPACTPEALLALPDTQLRMTVVPQRLPGSSRWGIPAAPVRCMWEFACWGMVSERGQRHPLNHSLNFLSKSNTSRLRGSPQRPSRIHPSMSTWSPACTPQVLLALLDTQLRMTAVPQRPPGSSRWGIPAAPVTVYAGVRLLGNGIGAVAVTPVQPLLRN